MGFSTAESVLLKSIEHFNNEFIKDGSPIRLVSDPQHFYIRMAKKKKPVRRKNAKKAPQAEPSRMWSLGGGILLIVAGWLAMQRIHSAGMPVRSQFLDEIDSGAARMVLGLDAAKPTLLVMGGSQGASGINQAMIKALAFLHDVPLQVIHLSGARDERLVRESYQRENVPAFIAPFHQL